MDNLFDLTGKVAIVTGSSEGIGKAIAAQLANHGASVVVSSRRQDACDAVRDEINEALKDKAGSAISIPCDISHKDQLQALVDETCKQLGKIDILVCNAAINPFLGSMLEIPDDVFQQVMDINIKSNHWLCRMLLPEMVERRDGVIIIIASIGGLQGDSDVGAYAISKAADMQLARNIAKEFGPYNIRANALAPGLIKTEFSSPLWQNEEALNDIISNAFLKRIGEPDDVAGVAVMLASKAGSFITGETLVIRGGRI